MILFAASSTTRMKSHGLAIALIALFGFAAAAHASDVRLASLWKNGETPAPGDRISVERQFNDWTLRCELRLSDDQRLCMVEQSIKGNAGAMFWRLAQTVDGSQALVFSLSKNMAADNGLSLKVGGMEMSVSGWSCSSACIAMQPLTRPLAMLLLASATVDASYRNESGQTIVLQSSLKGFAPALAAAAEGPFGKTVASASSNSVIKRKTSTDTATLGKSPTAPGRGTTNGAPLRSKPTVLDAK